MRAFSTLHFDLDASRAICHAFVSLYGKTRYMLTWLRSGMASRLCDEPRELGRRSIKRK